MMLDYLSIAIGLLADLIEITLRSQLHKLHRRFI